MPTFHLFENCFPRDVYEISRNMWKQLCKWLLGKCERIFLKCPNAKHADPTKSDGEEASPEFSQRFLMNSFAHIYYCE